MPRRGAIQIPKEREVGPMRSIAVWVTAAVLLLRVILFF